MRTGFLRYMCVVAALAFCLFPIAARAQVGDTGQISGTVLDPSGDVVPGAEVTAANPAISFTRTVKASATGVYAFTDLQPGTYAVSAKAKGFSTAVYNNVTVVVSQTTNVTIKLAIGSTSQTVTVSETAQVLQTTSNAVSTTISPTLINDLPLNGRDLSEFGTLVPGAANPAGIHGTEYTTFNAEPAASISITVNGTEDQFQRFKTFSSSYYPPAPLREGAFDEATVTTSGGGSASGAFGASQVQFATKAGTDQYHGRAFWQADNSYFYANRWTNNARGLPRPHSEANYFGGSLGGPLLPKSITGSHRVYFFTQIERFNGPSASPVFNSMLTQGAASGLFTYEVASTPSTLPDYVTCGNPAGTCTADLMKLASEKGAGNFPSSVAPDIQKATGQITQSLCKSCTVAPLANTAGGLAAADAYYLDNLEYTQAYTNMNWYPTARIDVDITPKVHLSESGDMWVRKLGNVPNWPSGLGTGGFYNTYYTWSQAVRWSLSPTMINTASFGITGEEEEYNPGLSASGSAYSVTSVQSNPSQIILPFGINTVEPSTLTAEPRNNPSFNPYDTLSWTHGNHFFYIGGDVLYSNAYDSAFASPSVPTYNFVNPSDGSLATGDPALQLISQSNLPGISNSSFSPTTGETDLQAAQGLYAFLTGRVYSVTGSNYLDTATGQYVAGSVVRSPEALTTGAVYFQDSWRARPHFTLNYGLRWNFFGALHNTNNTFFGTSYTDLLGPSSSLFTPGNGQGIQNPYVTLESSPYHGSLKLPAPNLGFAWNPDFTNGFLGKLFGGNNTVIRANYGLTFYSPGWESWEQALLYSNPQPINNNYSYSSSGGNFAPGSVLVTQGASIQNAAEALAYPPSLQPAIAESSFAFGTGFFGGVDPNIKYPYVQAWNFGIQRQLPGNFVVEVNYTGQHSVHGWQNYNIDEINATSNGFLTQFKNAQSNYQINQANGVNSFGDNTGFPGIVATPLFDAAFNGNGITTAANDPGGYGQVGYTGSFGYDLTTGQAGAMASGLAGTFQYFCNMAGGNFAPCGNIGGTAYPINYFEANPYAAGYANLLASPASGTYNALQISVRHPVGHGLDFGGNYTFAKALSSQFLSGWTDVGTQNYISLRDPGLNKGPATGDIRNVLHVYATYNLPFGKGQFLNVSNSTLNEIVGGWTVGTIIQAQSGLPFLIQGGYSTFNNQDGGVVLNGVTPSQLQSQIGVYNDPSVSPYAPLWLNPNFDIKNVVQPNTTAGTIGQVLWLHGPAQFNTDISLIKSFPIHERIALNIKANFINAFNHPNWIVTTSGFAGYNCTNSPGCVISATTAFNRPSAALSSTPREIFFETSVVF